ncbi:TetR/AcrR family transcriptional regulator [Paraburkholderia bryophila]|uniref:TetR/AcrR family transcriptional repressor of nem operon n=1 Tax=Paraburkholderia bryophila TaxID=420952 RepID=A0A7Z0BAL5_9BURK|nr:TetR/AcrR family transcriptional regulator [Paraburkholderia bryophila]NYH25955.1 TetR/AcrR family transcriptional repressor of nem operon [Paraburkholderia bryophila]
MNPLDINHFRQQSISSCDTRPTRALPTSPLFFTYKQDYDNALDFTAFSTEQRTMGHSQADKLATHERIVNVAAQRFRELGLEGISVADLMTEAGLTVGGFYKHFGSRDALVVEALAAALVDWDIWESTVKTSLRKAIRSYLSDAHRDNVATSCAFAALVNDVSRSSDAARDTFAGHLQRIFDATERALPSATSENRRNKSILLFSACVGALALSRSVADPKFSQQILDSVADELVTLFAPRKSRSQG